MIKKTFSFNGNVSGQNVVCSFYELLKHYSQIKRKKGTSSHNIAAHCRRTVLLGLISQTHFIIEREGETPDPVKWLQVITYLSGVVWSHCSL